MSGCPFKKERRNSVCSVVGFLVGWVQAVREGLIRSKGEIREVACSGHLHRQPPGVDDAVASLGTWVTMTMRAMRMIRGGVSCVLPIGRALGSRLFLL